MFWLLYIICDILAFGCFSIAGYSLILVDDLQVDNLNPIEFCRCLNRWVPVDVALQFLTTLIFLFYGHFFLVLWNLPLCCLAVYLYLNRGNLSDWGVYDPTRILRRDFIDFTNKCCYFKLFFYVVSVIIYTSIVLTWVLSTETGDEATSLLSNVE